MKLRDKETKTAKKKKKDKKKEQRNRNVVMLSLFLCFPPFSPCFISMHYNLLQNITLFLFWLSCETTQAIWRKQHTNSPGKCIITTFVLNTDTRGCSFSGTMNNSRWFAADIRDGDDGSSHPVAAGGQSNCESS